MFTFQDLSSYAQSMGVGMGGGRTIRQQANFFHRRHNLIQEYRG